MPFPETLQIEKLVYGGDGLSRLDGRVVFTPFVLPGETVRAEIERAKNDLGRGRLVEVVTPSAHRVAAPCPYFTRCGGCQYQHAVYEFQLESKRDILREVLRRVGKIEYAGDIEIVAGEPWEYRNRVQLHVRNGEAGYFEHGSHRLCAIERCPVASPALNAAIAKLTSELPRLRSFETTLELFTNETDLQVSPSEHVPAAARTLLDSIGSSDPIEYAGFRVSRNSFFQVNRFLVDRLVDCATAGLNGGTALDLYAGVGLFALKLTGAFTKVIAVESGRSAFRDLAFNIEQRAASVTAHDASTEDFLAACEDRPDLILADPPRTGLGKTAVRELRRIGAPNLVIVSCDPATLARDLSGLVDSYRIERISMVDLFPQTSHIETVVRLQRVEGA